MLAFLSLSLRGRARDESQNGKAFTRALRIPRAATTTTATTPILLLSIFYAECGETKTRARACVSVARRRRASPTDSLVKSPIDFYRWKISCRCYVCAVKSKLYRGISLNKISGGEARPEKRGIEEAREILTPRAVR